jgi:acetyl-CoA acetyltransferase family protein
MNAGEVFVCGGVESMTRVPMPGFNPLPNPGLYASFPQAYMGMGETAENLARRYQIPRAAQEEFALSSHAKAAAAHHAGRLRDEIVPIDDRGSAIEADGCIRFDTSRDALAALPPAFDRDGTVTAGTSAPLTDGAAAVLVCSEAYARRRNLEPLARIKSIAVAGCAPEIMGIGPVLASGRALERAGLQIGDMDVIELKKPAAQVLARVRDCGSISTASTDTARSHSSSSRVGARASQARRGAVEANGGRMPSPCASAAGRYRHSLKWSNDRHRSCCQPGCHGPRHRCPRGHAGRPCSCSTSFCRRTTAICR